MATGADWMSGASFVGMAGTLYALGYDGLAYVLAGRGYVLVAVLVAPLPAHSLVPIRCRTFCRLATAATCASLGRRRSVGLLVHLCGRANLCDRHHLRTLPRIGLQRGRVCRSRWHPGVLDARWHAGCDLDSGGAVHRADHSVPCSRDLDVDLKTGIPLPQLTYGQALQNISALEAAQGSETGTSCRSSTAGSTPPTTSCLSCA